MVRKNDFRASGSGNFIIDHNKIDIEMVRISFYIAKILKLQSVAFDFLKKDDKFLTLKDAAGSGAVLL